MPYLIEKIATNGEAVADAKARSWQWAAHILKEWMSRDIPTSRFTYKVTGERGVILGVRFGMSSPFQWSDLKSNPKLESRSGQFPETQARLALLRNLINAGDIDGANAVVMAHLVDKDNKERKSKAKAKAKLKAKLKAQTQT